MSSQEIDHRYTQELVCPNCGHVFSDSWEMADSDEAYYCDECGQEFGYERNVEVTYSSYKLDTPTTPEGNTNE